MPTLGYWNIRGVGQPIRFLLEYLGEKYDEKIYPYSNMDKWFKEDKFSIGLAFPDLPYYFDGDLKMTGSLAILKHISRNHKMTDSLTEAEKCDLEMMENHVYDFFWVGFVGLLYGKGDYEEKRAAYLAEYMPTKLKMFSDYLGNKKYILGDKITYVDFYMYEVLYDHSKFGPEVFAKFQNLKDFLKRIEELPAISSFMKTSRYIHSRAGLPGLAKWDG